MTNKAIIQLELNGLDVKSGITFENVNSKGCAILIANMKCLLNQIERKFEKMLIKIEKGEDKK